MQKSTLAKWERFGDSRSLLSKAQGPSPTHGERTIRASFAALKHALLTILSMERHMYALRMINQYPEATRVRVYSFFVNLKYNSKIHHNAHLHPRGPGPIWQARGALVLEGGGSIRMPRVFPKPGSETGQDKGFAFRAPPPIARLFGHRRGCPSQGGGVASVRGRSSPPLPLPFPPPKK